MSAGTSVPRPRPPSLGVTDSALLFSLLAEAPVGFVFLGPDARLLRMNTAMTALSGVADAAQPGSTPAELWPPDLAA
ncbi:MAG: PAS domain-containing protein, partial [Streptosporangiaceae bacterium]